MTEYRVVIPSEVEGKIVRFEQNGLVGIARIDSGLKAFEPKIVFAWHLSIMIRLVGLQNNRLPSTEESAIADPFCDRLESGIIGDDKVRPNALFVARVTVDGTQELIYRVYNPKPVDTFLQQMMVDKSYPRHFDYQIDRDPEWKFAEWYFTMG